MIKMTRRHLWLILLAALPACSDDDDDDDDGPTTLAVTVDEGCADLCTEIDVFINNQPFAQGLEAGDAESKEIEPGSVVITAQSGEGCTWNVRDRTPDTIPEEGLVKTLECNVPATPTLTVILDESCEEHCTEVEIKVDGDTVGELAEPGDLIEVEVGLGPFDLNAESTEGCSWADELNMTPMGLTQRLTCPEEE